MGGAHPTWVDFHAPVASTLWRDLANLGEAKSGSAPHDLHHHALRHGVNPRGSACPPVKAFQLIGADHATHGRSGRQGYLKRIPFDLTTLSGDGLGRRRNSRPKGIPRTWGREIETERFDLARSEARSHRPPRPVRFPPPIKCLSIRCGDHWRPEEIGEFDYHLSELRHASHSM